MFTQIPLLTITPQFIYFSLRYTLFILINALNTLYTVTDHLHMQSQISFFEGDNLFFGTDLNISEDTKSLNNKI